MPLSNAYEKFEAAVRVLVIGRGAIRERLADAFASELGFIQAEHDVPKVLRADFDAIVGHVVKESSPTEVLTKQHVEATIADLTEDEAVALAEDILSFAYKIEGLSEDDKAI